ncbi:MAG: hypothetical protein PWQ79_360 [Thermococcaceae archaeon]|nr:hypothetical protein [Thermococcaceae archaeon]
MERLRELMRGRKKNRLEFLRGVVEVLLSGEDVYSDEVLFRDTVEEIYSNLRSMVIDEGKKELLDAYEDAVILRAMVSGRYGDVREVLEDIMKRLEV